MIDSTSPQRLLVTGHTGFVGQALFGWLPTSRWARRTELVTLPAGLDIRDAAGMKAAVTALQPDNVLHLAAQSFVPASFRDPAETLAINVGGTLNLLQALDSAGFSGRFLYVSSADVYGAVDAAELPVDESRMPVPRNPYAVSKVSAELLCRQWHLTEGLKVLVARPFNHTGPGQDARFVLSGFAQRIAQIACGRTEPVFETGNLDVTRDFCDVRDVLDAYMTLFDKGQVGETYNVCSGVERNVGDLLRAMLARAGITARIQTDPSRLRPNEQLRMVGSAAKLHQHTGWKPSCDFEATLAEMVEWWQAKENQ